MQLTPRYDSDPILALDGDRLHPLGPDRSASVQILRDGPTVIDVAAAMRHASSTGLLGARPAGL